MLRGLIRRHSSVLFFLLCSALVILPVWGIIDISTHILKERAAWNAVFTRLEALPTESNIGTLLLDRHDPIWNGKEEYVTAILEKAIIAASEEGIPVQEITPIRIGVLDSGLESSAWGRARPPSSIVLYINTMRFSGARLMRTLVHEFSHLANPPTSKSRGHSQEWERTCDKILAKVSGTPLSQTKCTTLD